MRIQRTRVTERRALPGSPLDAEGNPQWYVTVQSLNRVGRDEFFAAGQTGGAIVSTTLYKFGICDFCLPDDQGGEVRFGAEAANALVYGDLDSELDVWLWEQVRDVNPALFRSGVGESLGNSTSSSDASTEATPSATGASESPSSPES